MKRLLMICAVAAIAATVQADGYAYRYKIYKDKNKAEAVSDREEDLYDDASDALDEHDWRQAAQQFAEVAKMKGSHADAATYWLAYAQGKMGMRSEALATLLDLQRTYSKSRWVSDAKALEVEIRQSAGQTIQPEHVPNEELKLLALNGLMQSDPTRAIPVVVQILDSNTTSIKIKDKALFVIAQSGSPQAITILSKAALDNTKPELRNSAIRYLAISGGDEARKALASTYQTTNDVAVKKAVLKTFVITGDKTRLLQIAKTEPNTDLRADAVRQLGVIGAKNELSEMYNNETSTAVRKSIIQAMFIGGSSEKLGEIARSEKDRDLRLTAIHSLGIMGGERSAAILRTIYDTDNDRDVKHAVIKSFFIQGNSHTLVELARKEKDLELKKEIISRLSLMGTKEAADYLMEFLKE
jgi:HEAT repeat protein